MTHYKFILFISLLIYCCACEEIDDPTKIELDYQYRGNFSIVVGGSFITLDEMGVNLDPNWKVFPDSLLRLVDTIEFEDALPFDLAGIVGQKSYVKSIRFLGNANNEFPTNDIVRFIYADEYENPIDSLDPYEILLSPASFVNDSTITQPGKTIIDMPLNSDAFNKWTEIKFIIIRGKIVNNITKFSQFNYYERHRIKINLAVQVEFDFNLNEFSNSK